MNPFDDFCKLNFPYWKSENQKCNFNTAKVFSFIESYGATFVDIQAMLLVKKIQQDYNLPAMAGYTFDFSNSQKKIQRKLYDSFNISKYIYIYKPNIYNIFKTAINVFAAFSCKTGDSLLRFCIGSIPVGESIYDWILRARGYLTIKRLSVKDRVFILKYVYSFYSFYRIAKKWNISFFVYTDCEYVFSSFVKVCKQLGIRIFQTNCRYIIEHAEANYKTVASLQVTHSLYEKFIKLPNCKLLIESSLKNHFSETHETILESGAFKGKREYSKTDLYSMYGLTDDKPCILVAAHAFCDAAHYSWNLIFRDYYDWLVQTLEILSKEGRCHIFVKEHPYAYCYGEQGSVAGIMKEYQLQNIYTIPTDLSTRCLFDFVDCFVTCCGTIGLEAACFGIPVITASKGYYYGYGLDYNCSDKDSYLQMLKNIDKLGKRSEIIETAKAVLSIVYPDRIKSIPSIFPENFFSMENASLTNAERMVLINKRMENHTPKDDFYNSQLEERIIYDDNCCPVKMKNSL